MSFGMAIVASLAIGAFLGVAINLAAGTLETPRKARQRRREALDWYRNRLEAFGNEDDANARVPRPVQHDARGELLMPKIEMLDGGDVFVVTIDPEATWDRSEFPHPLLTLDFDANDDLIKIVAVGSTARRLAASVHSAVLAGMHDASDKAREAANSALTTAVSRRRVKP